MPANVEWDIPFTIQTDSSDLTRPHLDLNAAAGGTTTGWRFLLDPKKCSCGVPLRVTSDDVPQADGAIFHRRYRGGYFMQLVIELWHNEIGATEDKVACKTALREMNDELMRVLNPLLNAERGRILWTPSGYSDQRMLDRVQLAVAASSVQEDPLGTTIITVGVDTPFPYAIDKTEIQTTVLDGATVTIANAGTIEQFPVLRVSGPTSAFTITNHSVLDDNGDALKMVYSAALPGASAVGGGAYIEFDHFKNTAYLNGFQTNMKPGIDVASSDFFPLVAGDNDIEADGADVLVLSNNAWA